jgi:hypothetical protein
MPDVAAGAIQPASTCESGKAPERNASRTCQISRVGPLSKIEGDGWDEESGRSGIGEMRGDHVTHPLSEKRSRDGCDASAE